MDSLARYIVDTCQNAPDQYPLLAGVYDVLRKEEDGPVNDVKGEPHIQSAREVFGETWREGLVLVSGHSIEELAIEVRTAALAFLQEHDFPDVEALEGKLPIAPLNGREPVLDEDWDHLFYKLLSRIYKPEKQRLDRSDPTLGNIDWLQQNVHQYLEVPAFQMGGFFEPETSNLHARLRDHVVASAAFPCAIEVAPRRSTYGVPGWPIVTMQFEVTGARTLVDGSPDPAYMGRFSVNSDELDAIRAISRVQASLQQRRSAARYFALPGNLRRPFLGGAPGSGRRSR